MKQKSSRSKNEKQEFRSRLKVFILKGGGIAFVVLCLVGIVYSIVAGINYWNEEKAREKTRLSQDDYGLHLNNGKDILDSTSAINDVQMEEYIKNSTVTAAMSAGDKSSWISNNHKVVHNCLSKYNITDNSINLSNFFGSVVIDLKVSSISSVEDLVAIGTEIIESTGIKNCIGVILQDNSNKYFIEANSGAISMTVGSGTSDRVIVDKLKNNLGSAFTQYKCYKSSGNYYITVNFSESKKTNEQYFNDYVALCRSVAALSVDTDCRIYLRVNSDEKLDLLAVPDVSYVFLNRLSKLPNSGKSIVQTQFILECGECKSNKFYEYIKAYNNLVGE